MSQHVWFRFRCCFKFYTLFTLPIDASSFRLLFLPSSLGFLPICSLCPSAHNTLQQYTHRRTRKALLFEVRGSKGPPRNVFEVIREIQVQFVKASESGSEIAKLLEVGTLPYHRKYASKMLQVVTPSLSLVSSQPSTSKTDSSANNTDPAFLDFNE
ncbi:hypothetical protein ES332_D13G127400v1 [Gossypium tomentosum]|uniref:DUF632 domain-containing protein n=1 Tax=Gossypium tomentosum TaxID=34277 RepID=A0A5D2HXM1_GOSTO|nr:hypothetical protein ES332_D13G127400v1 [Gossypium tomentosum]